VCFVITDEQASNIADRWFHDVCEGTIEAWADQPSYLDVLVQPDLAKVGRHILRHRQQTVDRFTEVIRQGGVSTISADEAARLERAMAVFIAMDVPDPT